VASEAAIRSAHGNPRVGAMWGRFFACCDAIPLAELAEAGNMFAEFTPVSFEEPPRNFSPDDRAK